MGVHTADSQDKDRAAMEYTVLAILAEANSLLHEIVPKPAPPEKEGLLPCYSKSLASPEEETLMVHPTDRPKGELPGRLSCRRQWHMRSRPIRSVYQQQGSCACAARLIRHSELTWRLAGAKYG